MRLIRTLVSEADRADVVALLDEHNVDHVQVHEESDRSDRVLVEFPLPTQAVESFLDELREVTDDDGSYTVVASAETVVTEHADEMEERFITGTEEDDSIATEEVRSKALDMTPSPRTYYSMTLLSSFVATAGLLLDSPAIVVGSMVIAPLVGSALTASVGTVLTERSMVVEGFKTQIYGLALAVVGATLLGLALKSTAFLPPPLDISTTQQISQRISPGLLSLLVGICAGGAGAFGLATDVSVTLVGVMIAAALVPAAAAVGIGIAWGIEAIALGAFLLLVLNALAIHVAGASVLWHLGYRPEGLSVDGLRSSLTVRRVGVLAAVVVVLATVLFGSGAAVASHIAFERDVNEVSANVLTEERYADLELISVRTEFGERTPFPLDSEKEVIVVVSRPADREYPELDRTVGRRIAARTDREVTVTVEFVERQTYRPDRGTRDVTPPAPRHSHGRPGGTGVAAPGDGRVTGPVAATGP